MQINKLGNRLTRLIYLPKHFGTQFAHTKRHTRHKNRTDKGQNMTMQERQKIAKAKRDTNAGGFSHWTPGPVTADSLAHAMSHIAKTGKAWTAKARDNANWSISFVSGLVTV